MSRFASILLCIFASACCSPSQSVRAADSRLLVRAERILPVVAQRLGVASRPIEIELSDADLEHGHFGAVLDGRIVMARAAIDHPAFDWMLAHEAVHVFLPEDLRLLPAAVQEGFADFIASQLEPASGAERVKQLQDTLASAARNGWGLAPTEVFALSMQEIYAIPDPFRRQFVYALGYTVASRLGMARLSELCREARACGRADALIPFLCACAGLDDTTSMGWIVERSAR